MHPSSSNSIVYKAVSYCLVAAFGYYWLFTFSLFFFNTQTHTYAPRQVALYKTFWRQNWRLFAFSKVYNRKFLLIMKDTANPAKTDTIDLVQYSVSQKRAAAPFNNFEDAIDHLMYKVMNGVETQATGRDSLLRKEMPKRPDSFYVLQGSRQVEADIKNSVHLNNLYSYASFVLRQKNISAAGKQFQFVLQHIYISPAKPEGGWITDGGLKTLFVSSFKPLP
jgi:hypothetical protein